MSRPSIGTRSARDRIVSVASDLFYRLGEHRVGINEVIERSGVAKMTLYHHFSSKDDLVDAVVAARSVERLAQLDAAIARARTPRRKVLATFAYLRSIARSPGYRGCAFVNAAADRADANDRTHRNVARHKQALEHRFETIARAARWRRPVQLATQLLLLWDGAAIEAYLQGSDAPVLAASQAADALIDASEP